MTAIRPNVPYHYNNNFTAGAGNQKQISTGRYDITAKDGYVKVYDRQSGTWTSFENKPNGVEMRSSDGNLGLLNKNATIDLQDGTKLTLGVGQDGKMDSVSVMKNGQAKVIGGLSDGVAGVTKSRMLDGARVDRWQADGSVFKAGKQVDDLYDKNGKEAGNAFIRRRSGKHRGRILQVHDNLNDRGGVSQNTQKPNFLQNLFQKLNPMNLLGKLFGGQQSGQPQVGQPSGQGGGIYGIGSMLGNLFKAPMNLLGGAFNGVNGMLNNVLGKFNPLQHIQNLIGGLFGGGQQQPVQPGVPGFGQPGFGGGFPVDPGFGNIIQPGQPGLPGAPGVGNGGFSGDNGSFGGIGNQIGSLENQINQLKSKGDLSSTDQLKLQELIQKKNELITMLTQLMQQDHQAKMRVLQNIR